MGVRHARKLQRGAHAANGFILRLTQLSADTEALERRLQQIAAQGIPNYYGLQRFGHEGGNLAHARHLAAARSLPEKRNVRSRLLSAARSYLFNRTLAARVTAGSWNRAQPGDPLAFPDRRSFFVAGAAECADPRLARLDLHPTGPLWGAGASPAVGGVQQLEQELVGDEGDLLDWLAEAGLQHERRILRLPIGGLTWHYPEPDILQLEFVLPAGCFATALVRELVDLLPAGQTDNPCVF